MANREQKEATVQEIKEKLNKASGVVLVNARGLTVAQDTELRRALREAGVDYKVYKNTLVDLAIKDTVFEPLADQLSGPTAVAVSYEDSTSGARTLEKYVSDIESLEYKAGVIDGNCYNAEEIAKIGKIPSREVLLGRLLGSLKGPMSSFARVINEIAKKGGAAAAAPAEEAKEEAPAQAPEASKDPAEEPAAQEAPAQESAPAPAES